MHPLFSYEGKRNMFIIGAVPSQRCHYNAVLQLDVSQLEGLEQIGRHGGNFLCLLKRFQRALRNFPHFEGQWRDRLIFYTFLGPLLRLDSRYAASSIVIAQQAQ